MKAHIGADADSGLVHSVIGTVANVDDVTQCLALLHGQEQVVFGDAGYQGSSMSMDISSVSLAGIAKTTPVNQSFDDVQMLVLKTAQDMQAHGALQLLQSATDNLPLATSGTVGTKVNTLA